MRLLVLKLRFGEDSVDRKTHRVSLSTFFYALSGYGLPSNMSRQTIFRWLAVRSDLGGGVIIRAGSVLRARLVSV
ncbi:hypothetical protein PP515_gp33 [Gordonia phage Sidious]|uniref:Uncharacterized protein n=1 Tax=Gordonia phage Sidious TaxID=2591118 RepID=A0A515MIA2_9CAUD|nr:hypothetical protein PP515_gp33 [Gordonia phage Sidious]QDM56380.1 hypothetical protein SEA_SIDIOUS_33 [Gordonia phage Sidious]